MKRRDLGQRASGPSGPVATERPAWRPIALEKRIAEYAAKFGLSEVPRPIHWMGWRLAPLRIEFWRDRPFRLHDRLEFQRASPDALWERSRLYP